MRDAHYKGAKSLGHGQDYDYPHDTPEAIAEQTYLAVETTYYEPVNRGYEQRIRERLDYWASLKEQRKETEVDEGQTNLAS